MAITRLKVVAASSRSSANPRPGPPKTDVPRFIDDSFTDRQQQYCTVVSRILAWHGFPRRHQADFIVSFEGFIFSALPHPALARGHGPNASMAR
jgi:hypothetical protein